MGIFVLFCMKCKCLFGVIKERLPPKASDSHWNESSLAALFKILQKYYIKWLKISNLICCKSDFIHFKNLQSTHCKLILHSFVALCFVSQCLGCSLRRFTSFCSEIIIVKVPNIREVLFLIKLFAPSYEGEKNALIVCSEQFKSVDHVHKLFLSLPA